MRAALGDGYVDALRQTYSDVPETVDYVMYWWHNAARQVKDGAVRRFGFITTNSITQTFNRRIIETYIGGQDSLILIQAIPDHPWVDSSDGAAVRIAMTVGTIAEGAQGKIVIGQVVEEPNGVEGIEDDEDVRNVRIAYRPVLKINPDLTSGADVSTAEQLRSNQDLAIQGLNPLGLGFRLSPKDVVRLGYDPANLPLVVRPYLIGRDLVQIPETKFVIDFFGLTEKEARQKYPTLFQHILTYVKPERDQNRRVTRRQNWWLFGENAPALRRAIAGLPRYIGTCRTAKHRLFTFIPSNYLPDAKIVGIGLSDAFHLGVLSSKVHTRWAFRTGAFLEDRPNYNHADCFNKFPFPACDERCQARIRELGEQLDVHRKRQQALHPRLTLTEMYNVLEKLRMGEPLDENDRDVHGKGVISVLHQIHNDLDAAVYDAYGWPSTLTEEEIIERLVPLNAERVREERTGLVRWLRPAYQRPAAGIAAGFGEEFEPTTPGKAKEKKQEWPKTLPEQARALRQMLAAQPGVVTPKQLAKKFMMARVERVEELLQTLVSLGQAREVETGRFAA